MKIKTIFLLIANCIPVIFCTSFYRFGASADMMLLPIQIALSVLAVFLSDKIWHHIASHIILLISTAAGIHYSTLLYYNNISSDTETLLVGKAAQFIGIIIVAVIFVVSFAVFNFKNKHKLKKAM